MVTRVPAPPFDDRPIDPYMKANARPGGCGVSYGKLDPNGASFDHSMYGTLSGTDAYFRKRDICSLTPWGIGGYADGALDGKIYRWMDYYRYKDVVPWSSGPWIAPGMGDGPAYVARYGVGGINGGGQAIETSDGGVKQYPMTQKQWTSLIWLKAYIAHREEILSDEIREYLAFMHHREICKPNNDPEYKDCPFPRIYNHTEQYLFGVVLLMSYFEGKHNNLEALVFKVATHTIDLRHVGRLRDNIIPPPPPPAPTGPIFYDFTPNKEFTVINGPANVRQYASTDSQILKIGGVNFTLPTGRKFMGDGYYIGEEISGNNKWVVMNNDPRGRVWSGLLSPAI